MVKTEEQTFNMHPKLLHDTISRQAGTLEKAILEGCMNGREAGGKTIKIAYDAIHDKRTSKWFVDIKDDGKGIQNKDEIRRFFQTFGTPHDENEAKIWAEFRMGRGQLFSFGKNIWRTGTFRMTVDFKHKGLKYQLESNLPKVKGCHISIELYNDLVGYHYSSIEQFKERVTKQVKHFEGNITFDGERINLPPSEVKWDFEDDDAYYMFNCGTDLKVYNIGAFVKECSSYDKGLDGIIVSKKMLLVNFARNDIQHDCKVWQRIQKVVRANVKKQTRKARRNLTDPERIATLRYLRDGEETLSNIKTYALIMTSQGKRISLDAIRKNTNFWTVAPNGDRYADKMMQRGQALCIDENILHQLGYTGPTKFFFKWLVIDSLSDETKNYFGNYVIENWGKKKLSKVWAKVHSLYRDYQELRQDINEDFSYFSDKDLKPTERRILKVLNGYNCWDGRTIMLGISDIAIAWSNGNSYICIDRDWLNDKYLGYYNKINEIFGVLAHEMTHSDDTRGSHIHGPEFYEAFHELILSSNSPTQYICDFSNSMKHSKIEERKMKEKDLQKKKQKKLDKKMGVGIAALSNP